MCYDRTCSRLLPNYSIFNKMLRAFQRNLTVTKNVSNVLLKFRPFTTAALLENEEQEFNQVKLLGTIIAPVRTLPSGAKSLIVRTVDDAKRYSNHLVNISSDEPMSQGNRIYVFGHLSSKPFTLDDGRLRHNLVIKAKYMRLRGHERNVETVENVEDQNNVKMLAKISGDIRHEKTHSLFTLAASHSPKREGSIPGMVKTQYHTVIVYDEPVRDVLRNEINKFDRVLVEGKVSYMPNKNVMGKTVHGGYIVAQSIQRKE